MLAVVPAAVRVVMLAIMVPPAKVVQLVAVVAAAYNTAATYSIQYLICYPYLTNWLNVYWGEYTLRLAVMLVVALVLVDSAGTLLAIVPVSWSFRRQYGWYR